MKINQDDHMGIEQMSGTETTSRTTQVCLGFSSQRETSKKVPKLNPIGNKPLCPNLKKSKFATSSTLTRTCSSAFSSTSAVKSAAVSRPLKRSETASKEQSCAVGSTVVCQVPCRPAPCSKMETIHRRAKVTSKASVSPWIKATSVDTKASAKMEHLKKSLGGKY